LSDQTKPTVPNEINVTKSVSEWNKNIHISARDLFKDIITMAFKRVLYGWDRIGESALDTLNISGFKKGPEEMAWVLVYRSLISAISRLTYEYRGQFKNPFDEKKNDEISELFDHRFSQIEVTVNLSLFEKPEEAKFLIRLKGLLVDWFKNFGVEENNALSISTRLPEFFVFALNEKWRTNPEDYLVLIEHFNTTFINFNEDERGWMLYNQWLKKQVNDQMFAEFFSVETVYVPLRAYCETKKDSANEMFGSSGTSNDIERVVFDLEKDFRQWLENSSSKTEPRFISGGPGSGKSTFVKIFAKRVVSETDISTLYIPLHRFDAAGNLVDAMEKYINGNRFLLGNPLEDIDGDSRLLIIFDGLDELALHGKPASGVINAFVDKVIRRIHDGNGKGHQCQVIVTGRPLAIQTVANRLRGEKQITHLLPYDIGDHERYKDPDNLLEQDQRDLWWKYYGKVSGKGYQQMPEELSSRIPDEITVQPLLNYLIAVIYDKGQLKMDSNWSLNQIYADLMDSVFKEQYKDSGKDKNELKKIQFIRILEEIAITMWHGDSRITTISSIAKKYLGSFQDDAQYIVNRLLTAFYFEQSHDRKDKNPTFEFSHKSYGEYLTAQMIFRLLRQIKLQINRNLFDSEEGWTLSVALEKWTAFCCPTPMDSDLIRYLENEFKQMEPEVLQDWQSTICDLISHSINNGLSFSPEYVNLGFKEHLDLAKNAEECLLAVHNAIAMITGNVTKFNLKSNLVFGEWISRLRGPRTSLENTLALKSLGFLDLSEYIFVLQDFFTAFLENSKFMHSQLKLANLIGANLRGAYLGGANLKSANLKGADLRGAYLRGANLRDANLEKTNLRGANFRSANLIDANFSGAYLKGADFEKADLTDANIEKANLSGANFSEANLINANLRGANLKGADFEKADFRKADLIKSNLRRTNLREADLREADLVGANLIGANLRGAYLGGANLKGANLRGANLRGADLIKVDI